MSSVDDHIENAVQAWKKYRIRQRKVEAAEDEAIAKAKGVKQFAKVLLNRDPEFSILVGGRNGFQEQLRTEALMAIMGLLFEIRTLLRGAGDDKN